MSQTVIHPADEPQLTTDTPPPAPAPTNPEGEHKTGVNAPVAGVDKYDDERYKTGADDKPVDPNTPPKRPGVGGNETAPLTEPDQNPVPEEPVEPIPSGPVPATPEEPEAA